MNTWQSKGVKNEDAQKSLPFYLIITFTFLLGFVSTVSFHVRNFVQSTGFTATLAQQLSH